MNENSGRVFVEKQISIHKKSPRIFGFFSQQKRVTAHFFPINHSAYYDYYFNTSAAVAAAAGGKETIWNC